MLPAKPKEWTACNGCGLCCAVEVCKIGLMVFPKAQAPCPALRIAPDRSRTYCGLVLLEKAAGLEPVLEQALAINQGCDTSDRVLARLGDPTPEQIEELLVANQNQRVDEKEGL